MSEEQTLSHAPQSEKNMDKHVAGKKMQMAFKHICTFKIKEILFKTMKYHFIIVTNTNKFENVVLVRV